MFETWLLITAILCYAIYAIMLYPSIKQLKHEHDRAEGMYLKRGTLIGKIGWLINKWHFQMVYKRATITIYIFLVWVVVTYLWRHTLGDHYG